MGMPDTAGRGTRDTRQWTRAEVLALPEDGLRHELVDGELLVSPTPRPAHQVIVLRLAALLAPYVTEHHLGMLFPVPADLDLQSGQVVQPDIFVATVDPAAPPASWEEFGVPILMVEVISPSTARYDRIIKRRRYQRSGVPVYWIADLEARLVEVWTPDAIAPTIVDEVLEWQPDTTAEPLVIALGRLFEGLG